MLNVKALKVDSCSADDFSISIFSSGEATLVPELLYLKGNLAFSCGNKQEHPAKRHLLDEACMFPTALMALEQVISSSLHIHKHIPIPSQMLAIEL